VFPGVGGEGFGERGASRTMSIGEWVYGDWGRVYMRLVCSDSMLWDLTSEAFC